MYSEHSCTCIYNEARVIPLPESFYFKYLMTTCRTNKESLTIRLLLQLSVSGDAVSLLVSELTVDILSTFCGVSVVHCVNLMLIVLLNLGLYLLPVLFIAEI